MATRRDNPFWRTKHERIAEAAFEEFSKSGFELASMEKIADAAGVSKVTVYNHFATKDQLFIDCCEYFFEFMFRPFIFDPELHTIDGNFSLELFIGSILKFSLKPNLLAMRNIVRTEHARMPALGLKKKESQLYPIHLINTLSQVLPVAEDRKRSTAELILSLVQVKCQGYADEREDLELPINIDEAVADLMNDMVLIVRSSRLLD